MQNPYFYYKNHELYAENFPLTAIAERFGTPCYVYSKAAIVAAYEAYKAALADQSHLICYAVKANANLAILHILARLGSGFDIVSIGELERVLLAGGDPNKVVFSGVGKREDEIRRALDVDIHCFNVESLSELQRINRIAKAMQCKARVSLRVNPNIDAKTHPYISTGLKDNKFGIDDAHVISAYQRAVELSNLEVIGIDCHIGSQMLDVEPFYEALDYLTTMIDRLAALGIHLRHVDIGGGLGVDYQNNVMVSPQEYLSNVRNKLANRQLTLVVEPGRSLVAHAGVLLTHVEYLKSNEAKNFAIVDAAMNDNIRPSLYQAWQQILPVTNTNAVLEKTYDIVGPVCETADFLGKGRKLCLQEGDLLALMTAGAYGFSMSSNYNVRNRAAEVLVAGDNCYLVRRRETLWDQISGETMVPGM